MQFRKDINGLRAVAVMAVVLFHFNVAGFSGGFIGVDVFFVLSGFLLTSISADQIRQGTFAIAPFLLSRARRILPALVVMVLVVVVWAGYSYMPSDYMRLVRNATSVFTLRTNIAFASTDYFAPDSHTNLLLHTWSLSLESQFYLVFPLVCAVLAAGRKWGRRRYIEWALWAAGLASLAWCVYFTGVDQTKAFYLLPSRAWEFMAGSAAALYGRQKPGHFAANLGATVALIVLGGCIIFLSEGNAFPGWRASLPVLATATLLLCRTGWVDRFLSLRPFQFLGDISYSLYLWHWPLFVGFQELKGRAPSGLETVGLVVVSIAVAWVSYRALERPVRRSASPRALLGTMVGAVAIGFTLQAVLKATDGWPQRLPEYLRGAALARTDQHHRVTECFRDAHGEPDKRGFCNIGSHSIAASPALMLWGDSHANQVQEQVSLAAAEAGVKGVVATQGGCPPLFGPAAPGSGADIWPACEKFAADAATYFEKTESLKTVVIAVNWLRYEPSFVSRTLSRIARVQAARGGQVVVILPVPNPGEDVPKQWIRRQLIAGKKISEWSIARDREAGVLQRSKELAAIAMNEANIILVDPFENLCDQDRCFTVKADRALYMDVEHLSTAGASLLQPAISKAIKRALVEGGASLPPMGEGD